MSWVLKLMTQGDVAFATQCHVYTYKLEIGSHKLSLEERLPFPV